MENNKYDGVCILFLCAIAPLMFMLFFFDNYVKTGFIFLSAASLFFWIILTGNKIFKCSTIFSTFITLLYLVLISMIMFMNYPVGNIFFEVLLYFLFFVVIGFFLYNFWKSNRGE